MQTPRSPRSSGSLPIIDSAARRSTLIVPIRLMLIAHWYPSRGAAPCLALAIRPAAPTPAQLTQIRRPPSDGGGRSDGRLDRFFIGDIGLDEVGADLFGERLALFFVEVGDGDLVSGRDEFPGGCFTESGCASEDDC